MNFEDVFCSRLRMKILKLLFRYGQMHTSDLAERLKVNYKTTLRLDFLEKENVIQHRLSGRIRYFRFANTLKARTTVRLFEEWEREQG